MKTLLVSALALVSATLVACGSSNDATGYGHRGTPATTEPTPVTTQPNPGADDQPKPGESHVVDGAKKPVVDSHAGKPSLEGAKDQPPQQKGCVIEKRQDLGPAIMPLVAAGPTGFLVTWQKAWDTMASYRAFDKKGDTAGPVTFIANTEWHAYQVVGSEHGFLVFGQGHPNAQDATFSLTRIAPDGTFLTQAMNQSMYVGSMVDGPMDAVVYLSYGVPQNGMGPIPAYYYRQYVTADGQLGWSDLLFSTDSQQSVNSGIAQIGDTVAMGVDHMTQIEDPSHFNSTTAVLKKDSVITQHVLWSTNDPYTGFAVTNHVFALDDAFAFMWTHWSGADSESYMTMIDTSGNVGATYALPVGVADLVPFNGGYVAATYDPYMMKTGMVRLDAQFQVTDQVELATDSLYYRGNPKVAVSGDSVGITWAAYDAGMGDGHFAVVACH